MPDNFSMAYLGGPLRFVCDGIRVNKFSFSFLILPLRIPHARETRARVFTREQRGVVRQRICRLPWIPLRATQQRSSGHINPFKAARARLYMAASRKKKMRHSPSQASSLPFFVFMPVFHSIFYLSILFCFSLTTFSRPPSCPFIPRPVQLDMCREEDVLHLTTR